MSMPNSKGVMFCVTTAQNCRSTLTLSPENYQQQFMQFIKAHSLSKQQAIALKNQVERSLTFKIQSMRQNLYLNVHQSDQTQSYTRSYQRQKTQTQYLPCPQKVQAKFEQDNFSKNKKIQARQSIGIQTDDQRIQNNQEFYTPSKEEQNGDYKQIKTTASHQDNVKNSDINSPRFNIIDPPEETYAYTTCNKVNHCEEFTPRESPAMHQTYQKSNKQSKKLFLLEDYRKHLQNTKQKTSDGQISFQIKAPRRNPQIFNKLYNSHTSSFTRKKQEETNTQQLMQYKQYLKQLNMISIPQVTHFQNLSIKTTQSFRAKLSPEKSYEETLQARTYKKSFEEHLKQKQKQRKLLQKIKRQAEKQGDLPKPTQLKGRLCQMKILLKQIEEEKQQQKQRQIQLKEKIKSQKRLKIFYDSSGQACSPPSKNRSRVCASCSPSKKQSIFELKQKQNFNPVLKQVNKKYVSDILSESYKEFTQQIK